MTLTPAFTVPGALYQSLADRFLGMDFYIVLCRAGFRVSRKKRKRGRVGLNHKITKAEAIEWVRTKFQAEIRK